MDHTVDSVVPSGDVTKQSTSASLATPDMLRLLIFVPVILLVLFGIVMVYSSSMVFSLKRFGEATYFVNRQIIFASVGLAVMFVASRLPVELYRRFTYPLVGLSALGLALCMTPLGTTVKGATRWISIAGGFNIQPSEIAKVAVVFFVSYLMVKKADRIKAFRVGFVPPVAVAGVLSLMCVTQPDFGAATMIMGLTFVLMFIGGVRGIYIGGAGLTAAVAGAILVYSSPYRMERIMGFLNPEMDPQGVNYQINESLISIGSGGVWGVGLGNGKQKLFFLPDAHTDFIASIVGEELGLVGLTVLLLLFATIIVTGVTIARRSRTEYGTFLASGLTFYLAFQVLTNLQVIMSLLPTKGLALPFMSYGGSSLITNLFAVGVIMSVARECGRAPVKVADEPSRAGANRRLEVPEAPMDDEPEELE